MLSLNSQIGKKAGPFWDEVTSERIRDFCKSIGSSVDSVAPPTFLTVFRKGEFELFQELGFELSQVLHAEQEYEYESPLLPGDRVQFETTFTQVVEKQNPRNCNYYLTFETRIRAQRNLIQFQIGISKTVVVIRQKKQ